MTNKTEEFLQHYGVKGMKWGIRRYQPYPKGKRAKAKGGKPGKEVGKAKSKRQIRKENRQKAREARGPSTRQLRKENTRIIKEETKKTREKYRKELQQDVDKAIEFGKKHGLDLDDGGGGKDRSKALEYDRMWRDIEKKQERISREANRKATNRMIKEFGQESVDRLEKSDERRAKAFMAGLATYPVLAIAGVIALDNLSHSDTLQHYGVKGMKWGVRRYQPYPKGSRNAGKFIDVNKQKSGAPKVTSSSGLIDNIKAGSRSRQRERSMVKAQKEIKNLSTKDARKVVQRAQLENRLKRLSTTRNVGDDQAKRDYLNRASMSDDELKRKVDRLQLADNMRQEARAANKEWIDVGKKVAAIAAPLAVQYIVHDKIDKKWLVDKVNPINITDWDKLGKQAANAVDNLL